MSWVDDTRAAWIAWLGATTPPTDAQATLALTLALSTVETYLDRPLESLERVQEDAPTLGVVWLRAWPVDSIASVVRHDGQEIELEHLVVDKRTGRLGVTGCYGLTTTTYTGGFETFPADLQMALWQVAAYLYPSTLSANSAAEAGQAIKRVTTPDVGTVEYAGTSSTADQAADDLLGGAVPQAATLLQRYRAESVVGGA